MKLYFLTNNYEPASSGGEIYNKALLEGAIKAGFTVEAIELAKICQNSSNIININIQLLKMVIKSPKRSLYIFDADPKMRYILALFWIKLFRKDATIVGMIHHYNYIDKSSPLLRFIHKFFDQLTSKQYQQIITNSQSTYESFLHLTKHPQTPKSILQPFVIPQPLKDERSLKMSTPINILFVGSLIDRKNVLITLKALSYINYDFIFTIVGSTSDTNYVNNIKQTISHLGLSNKIKIKGRVSDSELEQYYKNADLFLMVSKNEGYGMVYTEAMRYGIPIIAGNTGAVPEVVKDNFNGLLCSPHSDTEIAAKINLILGDKERYKNISENNIRKYKTFHSKNSFILSASQIFSSISDGTTF